MSEPRELAGPPPAPEAEHANPFEVLELGGTATMRDVTRQKDKLLGMLELGLARAQRYPSAVGERARTADLVRTAAQELERPASRLGWELWLPPSDEDVEADPDAAAMRRALLLHQQLRKEAAQGGAVGAEELDEVGLAWDEVLASGWLEARVVDRAIDLDAEVDEGEVVEALTDELRAQLRTLLEAGPAIDLDALTSELVLEVAHDLADRKIELLELACGRISRTGRGNQAQRQQQWRGLVGEYAAVITGRGDHVRRTAFQTIAGPISELAVELFNDDIDHATALAMFRWLRDEAANVGDEDLQATHGKNAGIVQARIARDAAALQEAMQGGLTASASSSSSESFLTPGNILTICLGIILALSKLSDGCKSTPSYEPPRIEIPRPTIDYERLRYDTSRYQRMLEDLPPPPSAP